MNLISADLDILESKELVNSTQLPFPSELPQFIEYLVCISLIAPKMLDADDGTNVSRNNFPRSAIILDLNIESNNLPSLLLFDNNRNVFWRKTFSRSKFVKRE